MIVIDFHGRYQLKRKRSIVSVPCFPLFNTCTRNFSAFCTQSCTSVCALPKSFKYRTGSALMPAAFVPNLLVMSQPVNTCVAERTSHIGFPTFTAITYRSPHFSFSWRRPCDNHAICCMDGKTMLAKPLAACAYLSSTVSELYDA